MINKGKKALSSPKNKKDNGPDTTNVESPVDLMIATQIARRTYDEYQNSSAKRWRLIFTACLGVSIAMNGYLITRKPSVRYIPTNSNGQIMTLVAMSAPNMSDEQVAIWVTKAISDTFSFNYVDFREELGKAQSFYTQDGWNDLQTNDLPHLIERVRENQYVMSAKPTKTPTLEATGLDNGVYSWRYKIPFHISFHSGSDGSSQDSGNSSSNNVIVEVVVKRQAETVQQNGLGISQIIMTEE